MLPLKLREGKSVVTAVGLLGSGLDELRAEIVAANGQGKPARVALAPFAEW